MKIIYHPNLANLKALEVWLNEEYEKYSEGFYSNWNIIEKAFAEDRLIIFQIDQDSIGFLVWSSYKKCVEIDIISIHPDYRGKGYGKTFYDKVEEYFWLKDFRVLELFCSPRESEVFWKKMNYIKFPDNVSFRTEPTYYKPLIRINPTTEKTITNKLELWDLEPYEVEKQLPKWTWEIGSDKFPILHPCKPDWTLRLTINGILIKEAKVKYFEKDNEIIVGSFLFIDPINSINQK